MAPPSPPPCANCERLQAQADSPRQQLDALQAVVAPLQERLAAARKDSSTSSKPPSSDLVQPPPPAPPPGHTKRPIGGPPGHPKHERPLFPPERVTPFVHTLGPCPCCRGALRRNARFARVVPQADSSAPPLSVEQHPSPEYWGESCRKGYYAPIPRPIEQGGLVGPRRAALMAYLKGVCHAASSTVRTFLRDVVRVTVSRGQRAKVIAKVSTARDGPCQELLGRRPAEALLNVDETGHKDNGVLTWTWCFRAELYPLFKIDPHRSADVLIEVRGQEFDGVLGCDCFSAYRRSLRECGGVVQRCLAHLIRDVTFLTTLPGPAERGYGERWRDALRALFGLIHRRAEMPAAAFGRQPQAARDAVLRVGPTAVPPGRRARAMANRLGKSGAAHFTSGAPPGVEPPNNLAEQALRFVVLDRHITRGTRGATGQRWSERMWTVVATCAQQGRSVCDYLTAAVGAYFEGEVAPSRLPGG